jgi:uncharacterized protein YecT (DUF1311 family)
VLGGVFISYRREDSGGFAGRIYDRLTRSLGDENVFFDVDSIAPGVDFVDTLSDRLGRCDALVAVIGRSWLSSADANNRRRLDNPNDYVRLEIGAALQRSIRVIPVLVDGATLPKDGDLPESLAKLTRRQAIEISLTRFDSDVERLIEALSVLEGDLRRGASAALDHAGAQAPTPAKDDGAAPVGLRVGGAAVSSVASAPRGLMGATATSDAGSWRRAAPVVGAILGVGVIIAAALLYANLPGRGPASHPWKPSFDCRLASGKAELMICNNEQLSQLDNELSVLYYTIRKTLAGDDQRQFDSAESVWVVERNTCSSDFNCVKKMYDDRIDELKKKLSAKP